MFGIKWRYFYIFLLGTYSFLNIKFTQGDQLISLPVSNWVFYTIILIIVLVVWEGNRLIQYFNYRSISRKISIKLLRHFGFSLILIACVTPVFNMGINYFLDSESLFRGFNQLLGFSFRINLFLHCINAIIVYNNELSNARIESEILKKETSEAKFDALRRQINPHFLFNSFNVLTSVIENDTKLAVQFVDQLSKVYRYLLRTQELKTIALEEEVEFIESYVFLLKIRFGDSLSFSQELKNVEAYLPPSTLQLLIENAIKHNEVSKSNPLTISLTQETDELVVTNNRNPKSNAEDSSGVGLSNIKKRYLLLGKKTPTIIESENAFSVRIPLIL